MKIKILFIYIYLFMTFLDRGSDGVPPSDSRLARSDVQRGGAAAGQTRVHQDQHYSQNHSRSGEIRLQAR